MQSLDTLSTGQNATITALEVDEALFHRLSALGFRVGKQLSIIRRGIFNGPLHVRLGTTDVILRKREAKSIHIQQA
jgi:ferrous iron transport protein A